MQGVQRLSAQLKALKGFRRRFPDQLTFFWLKKGENKPKMYFDKLQPFITPPLTTPAKNGKNHRDQHRNSFTMIVCTAVLACGGNSIHTVQSFVPC